MFFILTQLYLQTYHIFWSGVVVASPIWVHCQPDLAENIVRVYYHL